MTNEEAINLIQTAKAEVEWEYPMEYAEAFDKAIEALEKQMPHKPICIEDKMWTCPSCDNNLMWKWIKYPTVLNDRHNGLKYCLSCGQAIDWTEYEE